MGSSKHDDNGLDEVRRALASIPGSLAEAVIASRENAGWQLRPRHERAGKTVLSGTWLVSDDWRKPR